MLSPKLKVLVALPVDRLDRSFPRLAVDDSRLAAWWCHHLDREATHAFYDAVHWATPGGPLDRHPVRRLLLDGQGGRDRVVRDERLEVGQNVVEGLRAAIGRDVVEVVDASRPTGHADPAEAAHGSGRDDKRQVDVADRPKILIRRQDDSDVQSAARDDLERCRGRCRLEGPVGPPDLHRRHRVAGVLAGHRAGELDTSDLRIFELVLLNQPQLLERIEN